MSLEEIRETLLPDRDRTLLEYSLGDSSSQLWVVTRKEIRLVTLPKRGEIENEVGVFRAALLDPSPAGVRAFVASSRKLHELLLAPAARTLEDAKDVAVVPDGALHRLPFEALLSEDPPAPPDDRNPAAGRPDPGAADLPPPDPAFGKWLAGLRYALDGKAVRYGPSATTLAVLAREGRRKPQSPERLDLLAVGDPAFGSEAKPAALPWTRKEVEAIGALFPSGRATLLLGADAREKTITARGFLGRYRILHFATHGLVNERRPERSSLVLSVPADSSEDGGFEASEIYRERLDADLVVLSACETGLGKVYRGEGVLGLPRAFLFAGASSVVLSLWSVSDRSTSEFMLAFYSGMIQEGMSPAAALARARRTLRADPAFVHPFHWAPFVMMGVG
jgi:CHAT domain-containing protein